MLITTPLRIDLNDPLPLPVINLKQGDSARGAVITLTSNGQVISPDAESVNVFAKKQDRTLVYNVCEIVNGEILVKFTNQMTAVAGKLPLELELVSADLKKVSTPIAIANVLPTNIKAGAIESTNEFKRYETIISDVTAAETERESAEDARAEAENARKEAEDARKAAEVDRAEEESERISAETSRSEAEALRAQAEALRNQAEAAREAAEELREAAKAAMEQATEAANAAAEAAGAYVLGDISGKTVDFTEVGTRVNLASGESTATLFGKIKRWFADLKDAAFAAIANDLATTTAGSVLDARQGKVLDDKITQLNGKIPARYAGSASAGGSATSAIKLDTATAGSATQPVYFSGGKPAACTYSLAKSVPANAMFTDTNTWRDVYNVLTSTSKDASLTANMGRVLAISKAEMCKTAWGKSLTISASSTGNLPHGIVMFCNNVIYGLWAAGNAGSYEANITLLHGDNVLTFSCDRNTGVVTVRAASDGGFVYIGA